MTSLTNIKNSQIIQALCNIGTEPCLKKARALEKESSPIRTLSLRNLSLSASDVTSIANCLNPEKETDNDLIKSISFSYNSLLGDSGVIALAKNLSKNIREVGLVNCGISDIGGSEILNWMKNAPQLQMICMEQNNFSETLKSAFREFSRENPQILVVI